MTAASTGCACAHESAAESRASLLKRARRLTLLTLSWNVIEGAVALTAAVAAGSSALLGFGADSVVESSSAAIMLWRLSAEKKRNHEETEALDKRARKAIAVTLFVLAAYVLGESSLALLRREHPDPSSVGIAITSLSLVVMLWLARAKRATAKALGSKAMESDAFQTTACWWLSLIALSGIGLNAVLGWWWADPVAAIAMTPLLFKEGREAWRGEDCCG